MSQLAKLKEFRGTQTKPTYQTKKVEDTKKDYEPKIAKVEKQEFKPFAPALPFIPTVPTQERLSFNQPKLIESDLPKTTKVTAPITGSTFGLDNVKTYQAPIGQSKKELDIKDKAEKKEAKETAETLQKELTEKYGFKVKRVNSPIEYANILLKVPANQKEQFKKDYDQYILAAERSNPFRAGAEAGFNILPTNLEKTQGKETVEQAKGYGLGRFVGGAGQQAAFASVLSSPIEGLVGKILPKATPFVAETIKDVAIGTGTQLAEAPFDKPTAGQFVGNMAMDIALNALFGAVGKGLSKIDLTGIKTAKPQGVVREVAKQMDINESQANDLIDRSIDVYVNQYGVADTKPFEQLQLPAPKEQGLDAFTQWRKDNFGGAYGKLSPEDEIALKQLYKEDTGIDLLGTKKEVPRTVTQNELPTKPIVEPLKTELPKTEVVKNELDEFDAYVKEETDGIKNTNIPADVKSKRLKGFAMEMAAERRKIVQGDSLTPVQGGLTAKELEKEIARQGTNFKGKVVTTPDGEGTVVGTSFGKVRVDVNGQVKSYDPESIVSQKPVITTTEQPIEAKPIETKQVLKTTKEVNEKYKTEIEKIKTDVSNKTITMEQAKEQLRQLDLNRNAELESVKTSKPTDVQVIEPTLKPTQEPVKPILGPIKPILETPVTGSSPGKFFETASKSQQTSKPLRDRIKEIELETTTDKARLDAAKKIVDESPEEALALVLSGDKFTSDMEGAIGNVLYGKLQESGRYDDAFSLMESLARKVRKSGQEVQIFSLWSKTTPEGMSRWAEKTLREADVEADPKLIQEIFNDMKSIQESTPEQLADLIKKQTGKNEKFVDKFMKNESVDYLKEINTALVMKKVTDKLKISSARKVSTIQAMSHLLNARTFNRNILGNITNTALEQLNKPIAAGVDKVLSNITGRRTIVADMPKWQIAMSEAMKQGKRSYQEIMLGVNKVSQDKYDLFFESAFKGDNIFGKAGRLGEKALSLSLGTPDEFFKGFSRADSLYNQVRARVGKDVKNWDFAKVLDNATPQEIQRAIDEAKFVTFQNDSFAAKFLQDTKKLFNKVGYGKTLPGGMKEFGVGDLVIKYTRVPGNIIARSIDYSPAGLIKVLALAGKVADSPQAQREFSQVLGRTISGSSMAALGGLLSSLGIIISEDSDNYDKSALASSEGRSGVQINLSGLGRLLTGGSAELQEGDKLTSFDWIPVIGTSLSVGNKIYESGGITKTNPAEILRAFSEAAVEQATDLPTMYTIRSMMNEAQFNDDAQWYDIAAIPFLEALPGFVPSPLRQAAQTIDPIIRETRTKEKSNAFPLNLIPEATKNKVKANLPGFSQNLEPRISPLGEVQKREGGLLGNFILPATVKTYKPSGLTPQLESIETLTGKTSMYPDRKAPNTIEYTYPGGKKEDFALTPKEKTTYQETFGQEVQKRYKQILQGKTITTKSEADLIYKKLQDAESEARTIAKRTVVESRKNGK